MHVSNNTHKALSSLGQETFNSQRVSSKCRELFKCLTARHQDVSLNFSQEIVALLNTIAGAPLSHCSYFYSKKYFTYQGRYHFIFQLEQKSLNIHLHIETHRLYIHPCTGSCMTLQNCYIWRSRDRHAFRLCTRPNLQNINLPPFLISLKTAEESDHSIMKQVMLNLLHSFT